MGFTQDLKIAFGPRVATPMQGLDMVYFMAVTATLSAMPVCGVEDTAAHERPPAAVQPCVLMAHLSLTQVGRKKIFVKIKMYRQVTPTKKLTIATHFVILAK